MKKKTIIKISFAVIAIASLSSCTVAYRTRHPRRPRYVHEEVRVVGMAKPVVPVNATVSVFAQPIPATKAFSIAGK